MGSRYGQSGCYGWGLEPVLKPELVVREGLRRGSGLSAALGLGGERVGVVGAWCGARAGCTTWARCGQSVFQVRELSTTFRGIFSSSCCLLCSSYIGNNENMEKLKNAQTEKRERRNIVKGVKRVNMVKG